MSDNLKLTDINTATDLRTLPAETPYLEAWRQFYCAALTGILAKGVLYSHTQSHANNISDQASMLANTSMIAYEAMIQSVRADQHKPK